MSAFLKQKTSARKEERKLTAQVKQAQHHLPPSASTALIPSVIVFLHALHFGFRKRTWHASQYGCPLYTVKPTSSPSSSTAISKAPSPLIEISLLPLWEGGFGIEGARNGSPHSAQKKCCSWYVRSPSCSSFRVT